MRSSCTVGCRPTVRAACRSPVRSPGARPGRRAARRPDRRIFLALQPSDPHVSLPTLAVEKRGCGRRCSGEEPQALLSVIEVNVFVDQATRSTSQIHDRDNYQKRTSDLPILRAAYRNRTDDLRITRRIPTVHRRPPRHFLPAHPGSRSRLRLRSSRAVVSRSVGNADRTHSPETVGPVALAAVTIRRHDALPASDRQLYDPLLAKPGQNVQHCRWRGLMRPKRPSPYGSVQARWCRLWVSCLD